MDEPLSNATHDVIFERFLGLFRVRKRRSKARIHLIYEEEVLTS